MEKGQKIGLRIWSIYSSLGNSLLDMLLLIVMFFGLKCRPRAIYYAIAISAKIVLINFLKMMYMEPRPYWHDHTISVYEKKCATSYGNPSGHAIIASTLAFIPFLDLIRHGIMPS